MQTTTELRNLTEEELDAVAAGRNLYYEEAWHNWFHEYFDLCVPLMTST